METTGTFTGTQHGITEMFPLVPPLEHVEAGRRAQFEDHRISLILRRDELELTDLQAAQKVQAELIALDEEERHIRGLPASHCFDVPTMAPAFVGDDLFWGGR